MRYYQRFQKLSQTPEAKISSLVSLTIFTVAFFGIFAILPTLQTIAQLNRQIEDARLVDSKLQQKIVVLNKAEEEYLRLTAELPLVNRVLPEEPAFDRLAWQINWLTNNLNLTIVAGSYGDFFLKKGPADNILAGLPVEISVNGSYQQIRAFIAQMVNLDRLIIIETVNISNKKTSINSQGLTANIKFTAYYLPPLP
jgi:Tfp pilus assembly protein PilO